MSEPAREATRDDLYAVKDIAEGGCTCPVEVEAIKSDLKPKEFKRLACKPCRARRVLVELVELSEES